MDPESGAAYTDLMTNLDAPLLVVTAAMGSERAGCLVGFHAQSSMEPQRFTVWLSKANHTYRVALRARHLGVHFLSVGDLPIAEHFGTLSGDSTDKFAHLLTTAQAGGVPILRDWPRWLLARRVALLDEGSDHICVVTEPISAHSSGPFEPLRMSDVQGLVPGHANDERHNPPTERAGPDLTRPPVAESRSGPKTG